MIKESYIDIYTNDLRTRNVKTLDDIIYNGEFRNFYMILEERFDEYGNCSTYVVKLYDKAKKKLYDLHYLVRDSFEIPSFDRCYCNMRDIILEMCDEFTEITSIKIQTEVEYDFGTVEYNFKTVGTREFTLFKMTDSEKFYQFKYNWNRWVLRDISYDKPYMKYVCDKIKDKIL